MVSAVEVSSGSSSGGTIVAGTANSTSAMLNTAVELLCQAEDF